MKSSGPVWKRLKLGSFAAFAGALAVNASLGWLVVHSPDGARFLAMHPAAPEHRMIANLGQLSPVNVCAQRKKT